LAHVSQSFQFTNRSSQFARPRLELLKQADVFDGDDGLIREGLLTFPDLLLCERAQLHPTNYDHANRNVLPKHRRRQHCAKTEPSLHVPAFWELVLRPGCKIFDVNGLPVNHGPARGGTTING
jgi:hypothetical protein